MPPKKKEKKAKKKQPKPPKITKSQYLAKIAESNALLAAARTKTAAAEDAYFDAEKRYDQLQEDMADIIEYLQREIEDNEEEIVSYNERIVELKIEMQNQDAHYETIFAKMDSEYEEKNTELQHQMEQITAKLFASEEVRKQREEFLRQKEALHQKLEEMEARQHQEIYELEKEIIIKQDTMQKEMETKLTSLATDFRQATDIAIGETTNKLIRDNISLGNMLTCMQEVLEKARHTYKEVEAVEKTFRYNGELLDEEYFQILKKYSKRLECIEKLLKGIEELNERIGVCQQLSKDNRRLQRQIGEKECMLKEKTIDLDNMLKILDDNEEMFNTVKNTFNLIRKDTLKLQLWLLEAARCAREAIDAENMKQTPEMSEETFLDVDKEEQEEALKELKYKARETAIETTIEKFNKGMLTETELQLVAMSSDSYSSGFRDSISTHMYRLRYNIERVFSANA